MSDPKSIVTQFYEAFVARDPKGMAALYHPQVDFTDPVFVGLKGEEAAKMWAMLNERSKDLKVELVSVDAHGDHVHAHWRATYTFATTGRKVLNLIYANMEIADGRIRSHRDDFNFWRWSRQALGLSGLLLGFTPIVQNKVRGTARKGLDAYLKDHPEPMIPPLT
ncbi:MAG: nuclear transport factor 2 family protein [Myxococcota bacterium]